MEMIDLSRIIYDGMPKIPILPDVHVQRFLSMEKGHPLNVTELSLPCHAGTHVDAPVHIVPNGKSIDELPLEAFAGDGAVISVKKHGGRRGDRQRPGIVRRRGETRRHLDAAHGLGREIR
jgi:kynurenine formamidase